MDELICKVNWLLDEMRKEGTTKIDIDFRDLAKIYQILNMMKQIEKISEWCKEGHE